MACNFKFCISGLCPLNVISNFEAQPIISEQLFKKGYTFSHSAISLIFWNGLAFLNSRAKMDWNWFQMEEEEKEKETQAKAELHGRGHENLNVME